MTLDAKVRLNPGGFNTWHLMLRDGWTQVGLAHDTWCQGTAAATFCMELACRSWRQPEITQTTKGLSSLTEYWETWHQQRYVRRCQRRRQHDLKICNQRWTDKHSLCFICPTGRRQAFIFSFFWFLGRFLFNINQSTRSHDHLTTDWEYFFKLMNGKLFNHNFY